MLVVPEQTITQLSIPRCQHHSLTSCGTITFSDVPVLYYLQEEAFANTKPTDIAMLRYGFEFQSLVMICLLQDNDFSFVQQLGGVS